MEKKTSNEKEDDKVTLLYSGWARSALQIGAEGSLYACGIWGAASGKYEKYILQNHELKIQSELKYDYWSDSWFYYNPDGYVPEDEGMELYAISSERA